MENSKYKTVFIETTSVGKGLRFKMSVNGDQLSRDMQASIEEMERKGFKFIESNPISGYHVNGYTSMIGMMMVFKKHESAPEGNKS